VHEIAVVFLIKSFTSIEINMTSESRDWRSLVYIDLLDGNFVASFAILDHVILFAKSFQSSKQFCS